MTTPGDNSCAFHALAQNMARLRVVWKVMRADCSVIDTFPTTAAQWRDACVQFIWNQRDILSLYPEIWTDSSLGWGDTVPCCPRSAVCLLACLRPRSCPASGRVCLWARCGLTASISVARSPCNPLRSPCNCATGGARQRADCALGSGVQPPTVQQFLYDSQHGLAQPNTWATWFVFRVVATILRRLQLPCEHGIHPGATSFPRIWYAAPASLEAKRHEDAYSWQPVPYLPLDALRTSMTHMLDGDGHVTLTRETVDRLLANLHALHMPEFHQLPRAVPQHIVQDSARKTAQERLHKFFRANIVRAAYGLDKFSPMPIAACVIPNKLSFKRCADNANCGQRFMQIHHLPPMPWDFGVVHWPAQVHFEEAAYNIPMAYGVTTLGDAVTMCLKRHGNHGILLPNQIFPECLALLPQRAATNARLPEPRNGVLQVRGALQLPSPLHHDLLKDWVGYGQHAIQFHTGLSSQLEIILTAACGLDSTPFVPEKHSARHDACSQCAGKSSPSVTWAQLLAGDFIRCEDSEYRHCVGYALDPCTWDRAAPLAFIVPDETCPPMLKSALEFDGPGGELAVQRIMSTILEAIRHRPYDHPPANAAITLDVASPYTGQEDFRDTIMKPSPCAAVVLLLRGAQTWHVCDNTVALRELVGQNPEVNVNPHDHPALSWTALVAQPGKNLPMVL